MMVEVIDDFISKLSATVQSGPKSIDFLDEINSLSLQVVCKTAMGYKLKFDDPVAQQYRHVCRFVRPS